MCRWLLMEVYGKVKKLYFIVDVNGRGMKGRRSGMIFVYAYCVRCMA